MDELRPTFPLQSVNQAVVAVASAQEGVVARRQLLDLGVGRRAIESWLRNGLVEDDQRIIDVTSTGGRGRLHGVRVHRGRRETERIGGLPVTTVQRTLVDLAAVLGDRELERAVDQAIRDGHRVEPVPRRGIRGAAALAALNRRNVSGHTVTRSELEERVLKTIRARGLPEPEMNTEVEGFLVDAVWRSARIIVELDGARWHAQPGIRRADRRRDMLLTAAGWRPLRAGWHDLAELTATLATMLSCAPSPPPRT